MIKDVLFVEGIDLSLTVKNKEELFMRMTEKLYEHHRINDINAFLEALRYRENEGVTGMGEGLAIPHGMHLCVTQATVLFCKLTTPIEYESLDNEPVDKVFMIAVPEHSGNEHLKIISTLARKLIHKEFIDGLDNLQNKEDVLKLF